MKKRVIALLLTGAMLMAALAGCGGNSSDTSGSDGTTSAQDADSKQGASEGDASDNFNAEGYPIVKEEITLKVMLAIRDTDTMIAP